MILYTDNHTVSDLILYGSSFISKYNGQNENMDDLNTGKPSALKIKDMLIGFARNPVLTCCWYKLLLCSLYHIAE